MACCWRASITENLMFPLSHASLSGLVWPGGGKHGGVYIVWQCCLSTSQYARSILLTLDVFVGGRRCT